MGPEVFFFIVCHLALVIFTSNEKTEGFEKKYEKLYVRIYVRTNTTKLIRYNKIVYVRICMCFPTGIIMTTETVKKWTNTI